MNNGLMGYPQRTVAAALQVGSTNATRVGYSSSGTWTVPAGITRAVLHLNSAGAGGGGGDATSCGGGGNGGNYLAVAVDVTPGEVLTLTLGAAGTGGVAGQGLAGKGGDITVTRANGTILAWVSGGLAGLNNWARPSPNVDIYIANGTLIAYKKGGRGGRGHSVSPSYGGGGGGGAGQGMGQGIEATDGTPAVDTNTGATYGVGGLGSTGPLGVQTGTAGVSPPITLSPESGSGASYNGGAGAAGGRGAGGSGATGNNAGGPGGAAYALVEY